VTLPLPPDDAYEANADIPQVARESALRPVSSVTAFAAVDDDPTDVYPVTLRAGQRVRVTARANRVKMRLAIWAPGTRTIRTGSPAASTRGASRAPRLGFTAPRAGRWYVSVRATSGAGAYQLTIGR
jgi:hypothetical protein